MARRRSTHHTAHLSPLPSQQHVLQATAGPGALHTRPFERSRSSIKIDEMSHSDTGSDESLVRGHTFPKLNGRNTRRWFDNIETKLMVNGLFWTHADPEAELDEEADLKALELTSNERVFPSREQSKAYYIILANCERSVRRSLADVRTGRGALRRLLEVYRKTGPAAQLQAYTRFLQLRMKEEEDVMEWSGRILEAKLDYSWAEGRELEEIELISKLLSGITETHEDANVRRFAYGYTERLKMD